MAVCFQFDTETLPRRKRAATVVDFLARTCPDAELLEWEATARLEVQASTLGSDVLIRLRSTRKVLRRSLARGQLAVFVVTAGTCQLRHAGRAITLTAGQLALVDDRHPWELQPEDGFEQLVLETTRDRLVAGTPLSPRCRISGEPGGHTSGDIHFAATLASLSERASSMTVKERAIAGRALRALLPVTSPFEEDGCATIGLKLAQALALLQDNAHDAEFTPARLAERLGVSRRYLDRMFAEHDQSVAAALREQRLQLAAHALHDPAAAERTLLDVALSSGFSDASSFSRTFRCRFGVPPSAYRASRQREQASWPSRARSVET